MQRILNKQVMNTAMMILLALGVSACSVNSGNGDLGSPVTSTGNTATTNNASSNSSASNSTTADNTADTTTTPTTDNSATTTTPATTDNTATTDNAVESEAERVKRYSNAYFATQTDSYAYKRISNKTEYETLVSEAKAAPTLSGNCLNNATSGCRGTGAGAAEAGKVMKSYQTAYSGYGVLREEFNSDNANNGIPNNAYFYYVDTPTTDKSKVVDATYTGQVSYSKGNSPAISGSGASSISALTMTVKGDTISGKVTKTYGSTNKTTIDMITFNQGAINVATDGAVGFNGTAEFNGHAQAFNTTGNANFTGTYKGQFAGENAEEMVGTFESDSTAKDVSVQGAFSATK